MLWPGKTRNKDIRSLQDFYLKKINQFSRCEIIETKEARGLTEKDAKRIMEIEAKDIEKHLRDDYIICLHQDGREMDSLEFATLFEKITSTLSSSISFIIGGFIGLEDSILKKADFLLSLSKFTFSHELSRIILLEQVYRALSIINGRQYAK